MIRERVSLDLASAAFYSAQDFVLCWDDLMNELDGETGFTEVERQEIISNYRAEVVEYIWQFCGFITCQVYKTADVLPPTDATTLTQLCSGLSKLPQGVVNVEALSLWTETIADMDTAHDVCEHVEVSKQQKELYRLLSAASRAAEQLVDIHLELEEMESND